LGKGSGIKKINHEKEIVSRAAKRQRSKAINHGNRPMTIHCQNLNLPHVVEEQCNVLPAKENSPRVGQKLLWQTAKKSR
jgi:hypothetical protein